ncbi:recombination protein RecR [Candidatus Roizmanbacteria bacterium CG10_big_fil_rev_8_21_14_0_10_45_7]|uniref:Recombination protein RecR n=1 Tax=Candidatus Roizmanbacteria bacterium CG10_big_fil_rev_8_21_14_0_10_45_7 TaxID=1974854 RepID=A0A2M8KUH9_9BACT|nr:MAG: recombination protein RecR [Candidatus Roizmanbacteria bacterium CG10_big_fil_rev_8_21_14_0_10_45_7]
MKLPAPITELIDQFEGLPGIGHKTASRLAFYMLNIPTERLNRFATALSELKTKTNRCSRCFNLTDTPQCAICTDPARDNSLLCIVEEVLDLVGIEQTRKYHGSYHVLYGRIDPLNNMGPDDILIPQLMKRLAQESKNIREIIIATNPTMEGETTAMYLKKIIDEYAAQHKLTTKISRLAYGLPMGASIEFADYGTLGRSFENRNPY